MAKRAKVKVVTGFVQIPNHPRKEEDLRRLGQPSEERYGRAADPGVLLRRQGSLADAVSSSACRRWSHR